MFYPEETIEEVRSRNDIVDVISGYVGLKKAGRTYKCCCPFHTEKTPSFTVSREKQMYHCFGCGAGGNVFTFLMKYDNLTFPEALKMLADRAGVSLPESELSAEEKKKISHRERLYEVNKVAAGYFHYLLQKSERGELGRKYYEKRGFTQETIQRFGLGFADIYSDDLYRYLKKKGFSDELMRDAGLVKFDEKKGPTDSFWNRVMVPIADQNGRVIGFGGRVLGDGKPKYINTVETEIYNKSRLLFNLNLAKRSRRKGFILCEGYMDVISQYQAGFDNAVASCGTALTSGHAGLVKRYTDEVYLAYDSDGAGRNATLKAIRILREAGVRQRVINLKPYKDPDEFIRNEGTEAYEERIKDAIPGRMFEIDMLVEAHNMNDPEEKTRFMKEAAVILAEIEDNVGRINYTEAVARKYMLDPDVLKREVTGAGMAGLTRRRSDDLSERGETSRRPEELSERGELRRKRLDPPETEAGAHLLSMMVADSTLFQKLRDVITPDDFIGEPLHSVAKRIFRQVEETGTAVPAAIVSLFDGADEQELVSRLLTKELPFEMGDEAYRQAVTDMVIKVKILRIEKEQKENPGANAIQLARKKNQIRNLRINLD